MAVILADGAAGSPSVTFANDGSVGIYRASAGVMGISGVGSVQIASFSATNIGLRQDVTVAAGKYFYQDATGGIGNNSRVRQYTAYTGGGSGYGGTWYLDTRTPSNSWVNAVTVSSGQNVGIGLSGSDASYRLHVFGSSPEFSVHDSGANGTRILAGATNSAVFYGNTYGGSNIPILFTVGGAPGSGAERLRIEGTGPVLTGGTADTTGVNGTGLKVKSNTVGTGYSAGALCLQGTGGDFYAVKFADQDMGILSVTSGSIDNIQIGGSATTAVLYSSGLVQLPNVGTTASAANVFMDSALSNQLARSTSSLRYKTDIEDLDTDRADAALALRPVWYRSKASADRKDWSHYGLIAEEVAEIEPRLVNWTYLEDDYVTVTNEYGIERKELKPDAKLVPDGVQYDRLPVLLLSVIQRQEERIKQLEAKLA